MDNLIKIEDFHPLYQMLAKIIGMDNVLKLGREFGGQCVYFPKLDDHGRISPFRKLRDRRIFEEFNGGKKAVALAREHKLTQEMIYAIIRREKGIGPGCNAEPRPGEEKEGISK